MKPSVDKWPIPFPFLSFGGGVNTVTAMILEKPKYLIFADTGDEHPETYKHIRDVVVPYVTAYGGEIHFVRNEKYRRLQDMAFEQKIIPVRVNRWCTDKFKIRPIQKYLRDEGFLPAIQMIAIDAGEAHRAKPSRNAEIENKFPLIERGLDREDCIQVIRAEGLAVPRKSGCFYCPFQSKPQWIRLRQEQPELYAIAEQMERNGSNFGKMYLAADAPLTEWLKGGRISYNENQLELALPCACYDGGE